VKVWPGRGFLRQRFSAAGDEGASCVTGHTWPYNRYLSITVSAL